LFGQPGLQQVTLEMKSRLDGFFQAHADPRYDLWRGGKSKAKRVTEE
jgi:hypothetical protein